MNQFQADRLNSSHNEQLWKTNATQKLLMVSEGSFYPLKSDTFKKKAPKRHYIRSGAHLTKNQLNNQLISMFQMD